MEMVSHLDNHDNSKIIIVYIGSLILPSEFRDKSLPKVILFLP